ncbi:MAG: hypothetical protein AAF632_12025 [Bacteroidota bacterium]
MLRKNLVVQGTPCRPLHDGRTARRWYTKVYERRRKREYVDFMQFAAGHRC